MTTPHRQGIKSHQAPLTVCLPYLSLILYILSTT